MTKLTDKTLELLQADSRPLAAISIESKIPYHWLKSFKYGQTKNPSADSVQSLYEFLTGRPLIKE